MKDASRLVKPLRDIHYISRSELGAMVSLRNSVAVESECMYYTSPQRCTAGHSILLGDVMGGIYDHERFTERWLQ